MVKLKLKSPAINAFQIDTVDEAGLAELTKFMKSNPNNSKIEFGIYTPTQFNIDTPFGTELVAKGDWILDTNTVDNSISVRSDAFVKANYTILEKSTEPIKPTPPVPTPVIPEPAVEVITEKPVDQPVVIEEPVKIEEPVVTTEPVKEEIKEEEKPVIQTTLTDVKQEPIK